MNDTPHHPETEMVQPNQEAEVFSFAPFAEENYNFGDLDLQSFGVGSLEPPAQTPNAQPRALGISSFRTPSFPGPSAGPRLSAETSEMSRARGNVAREVDILSAETFEPFRGVGNRDSSESSKSKESHESKTSAGPGRNAKRSRSDDQMSEKRQRGRPRLDGQDQSAIDRRRTQIRLAQRAYRNRKEETIASLQGRVSDLQKNLEEMKACFIAFKDFATDSGIADSMPAVSTVLEQSTERYMSLYNGASRDGGPFDDEVEVADAVVVSPTKKRSPRSSKANSSGSNATRASETQVWGYQIDPSPSRDDATISAVAAVHQRDQAASSLASLIPVSAAGVPFPPTATGRLSGASKHLAITDAWMPPIDARLDDPPQSFTFSPREPTFIRRLHRATLERAYKLLLNPNAPQSRKSRVFKLSLCFYDEDQLIHKLKGLLHKSTNEELYFEETPFIHLGDAGMHYPTRDSDGQTVLPPNSWVVRAAAGGLATLHPANEPSRPPAFAINLEGYEGAWFDANDVVQFLRTQGASVDNDSSFAEVLIEDESVDLDRHAPLTEEHSVHRDSQIKDSADISDGASSSHLVTLPEYDAPAPLRGFYDQFHVGAAETQSWSDPSFGYGMGLGRGVAEVDRHGFADAGINATSIPNILNAATARIPKRRNFRTATLDINKLLEELTSKAVCLGRSPGYRKTDVELAFKTSLQVF
ncbi:MAG: hypothetical protein M1825_000601 [Sarcosagium campestre]|nr:MAG: hypothetical protein M1825_000601 [Sarcosagium campestre]